MTHLGSMPCLKVAVTISRLQPFAAVLGSVLPETPVCFGLLFWFVVVVGIVVVVKKSLDFYVKFSNF